MKLFSSLQFSDLSLQGGDSLSESLGFIIYSDIQFIESFEDVAQVVPSLPSGSGEGVWHESNSHRLIDNKISSHVPTTDIQKKSERVP